MKTGLITSDTYQNHNTGDGHPEQIARVSVIIDNFKKIDNKKYGSSDGRDNYGRRRN